MTAAGTWSGAARGRLRRSARRSARRAAGWAVTCAALWLAGGTRGLVLGAAVVVWDLARPPTPRQLLAVAAALLALVPVAVLTGGLPTAQTISPLLAARHQAPHLLAGAGLALLVLGVVRDRGAEAGPASPPRCGVQSADADAGGPAAAG